MIMNRLGELYGYKNKIKVLSILAILDMDAVD